MQWTDLTNALGYYLQQFQNPPAEWTDSLPTIVNNAELRIYRDLDFLATRGQNSSLTFTAGNRVLSMAPMSGQTVAGFPTLNSYPVVVQGVAALVPPNNGRVRFILTSIDFIDMVWPDSTITQEPSTALAYYALLDHETVVVAPTPDKSYVAQVTGTWRPAPMSAGNPDTWLGDNLPDLLFKACMVEATGWMRDFGQQSDDPKLAMSWEAAYQAAKMNALEEEQRRKGQDPGWAPYSPTPLSGTPRH